MRFISKNDCYRYYTRITYHSPRRKPIHSIRKHKKTRRNRKSIWNSDEIKQSGNAFTNTYVHFCIYTTKQKSRPHTMCDLLYHRMDSTVLPKSIMSWLLYNSFESLCTALDEIDTTCKLNTVRAAAIELYTT